MPLSSEWWANAPGESPFRDNVDGAITAETMRDFALAVSTEAASDDWFTYRPGVTNLDAPYVWDAPSESETVWFVDGGPGQASSDWSYDTDPDGQAQFAYTGGVPVLVQVTVSGSISVTNVTEGSTVTPVLRWATSAAALGEDDNQTLFIGSPVSVPDSSIPVLLSVSGAGSVRFPAIGGVLQTGLLFVPPSDSAIQASGSVINLDLDGVSTLAIARQAAQAYAFNN
jgi:hypothetical protein